MTVNLTAEVDRLSAEVEKWGRRVMLTTLEPETFTDRTLFIFGNNALTTLYGSLETLRVVAQLYDQKHAAPPMADAPKPN